MSEPRFRRSVGTFDVAVDESHCIVFIAPGERRYTVTNVAALAAALEDAQTFVRVLEDERKGQRHG